jgi:hypothetical protein
LKVPVLDIFRELQFIDDTDRGNGNSVTLFILAKLSVTNAKDELVRTEVSSKNNKRALAWPLTIILDCGPKARGALTIYYSRTISIHLILIGRERHGFT